MTVFKILIILTPFIFTVSSTASCQAKHNTKKTAQAENLRAFRQVLWDSLPQATGYVNDYENIYSDKEEEVLDSLIRDFEKRTTIQIALITFDTTMTTADSLDALTLKFANFWGVGQKDKNNGVTIGISSTYRRMRIQNGYGIEKVLTDTETKNIIDADFIPSFRDANYFEGTYNGLMSLMKTLEQRYN